jgi:hypothetical protein
MCLGEFAGEWREEVDAGSRARGDTDDAGGLTFGALGQAFEFGWPTRHLFGCRAQSSARLGERYVLSAPREECAFEASLKERNTPRNGGLSGAEALCARTHAAALRDGEEALRSVPSDIHNWMELCELDQFRPRIEYLMLVTHHEPREQPA